jgi:murein L,D-transpeptidase YafK
MKLATIIGVILIATGASIVMYNLWPEKKLTTNTKINKLIVFKSKRELLAYTNGQLVKTYSISLGRNPSGDKEFEGDKKTPEGLYYINNKNQNSGYHKNLGISYPNKDDIKQAKLIGKPAGGDIKIHGLRNGVGFIGKLHRWFDWTLGCIALTNNEVDELYQAVEIGTPIEIYP